MSLKTPLFLALIVGAICLAIFFIWPDFQLIAVKKQELKISQDVVSGIKEKNANIGNLVASLNDSQNTIRKEFVLKYIPLEKEEENIFNSLSRIANSEGVTVVLGSLSVQVQKEEVATVAAPVDPQSSPELIFGSGMGPDGLPVPVAALPSERKIKTSMVILGKYENIKKFIAKLYTLDMLKEVSSVALTSANDDTGKVSENISASIGADFVFIPEAKINKDYNSSVFSTKSFDFAIVDEVQAALSQKAEAVTVEGAGRNNPFLP